MLLADNEAADFADQLHRLADERRLQVAAISSSEPAWRGGAHCHGQILRRTIVQLAPAFAALAILNSKTARTEGKDEGGGERDYTHGQTPS